MFEYVCVYFPECFFVYVHTVESLNGSLSAHFYVFLYVPVHPLTLHVWKSVRMRACACSDVKDFYSNIVIINCC